MPKVTLTQARELVGWTQTRLAREASAAVSSINELEHGHNTNPGYQLAMRIVQALQRGGLAGVSVEAIFPVEPIRTIKQAARTR